MSALLTLQKAQAGAVAAVTRTRSRSLSRTRTSVGAVVGGGVVGGVANGLGVQVRRRWMHGSSTRQAIMMPAASPLMTQGTVARWVKKEGEAFKAGDVLLQIESDIATIDIEANHPGILGKILVPDGTDGVPVEQVLALVAKDETELARMLDADADEASLSMSRTHEEPHPPRSRPQRSQSLSPGPSQLRKEWDMVLESDARTGRPASPSTSAPTSASSLPKRRTQHAYYNPMPEPPSPTGSPFMATPTRTTGPSLFELQAMGGGQRGAHYATTTTSRPAGAASGTGSANAKVRATVRAPLPRSASAPPQQQPYQQQRPHQHQQPDTGSAHVDGAAIRRMIVSNLASRAAGRTITRSRAFDDVL